MVGESTRTLPLARRLCVQKCQHEIHSCHLARSRVEEDGIVGFATHHILDHRTLQMGRRDEVSI